MLFQIPPPAPAVEAIAEVVVVSGSLAVDCEQGSRDCFPEDRVGLCPETMTSQVLDLRRENLLV